MRKQDIAKFIDGLKKTEHSKFQIKGSSKNAPKSIHYYNSHKQFTPDVIITCDDKRDFYVFESEIKEIDISDLTFKWILFSAQARKLNGQFYLVVDKSKIAFCKKVISDKQLEVVLVEM